MGNVIYLGISGTMDKLEVDGHWPDNTSTQISSVFCDGACDKRFVL